MSREQVPAFKEGIFARKNELLQKYSDVLKDHRVTDIIFFPDFFHSPMIRIDDTGMSGDEVVALEAASEEFLVRESKYAGIVNNEVLRHLLEAGYGKLAIENARDEHNADLLRLTKDFLKNADLKADQYRIWEIEIHDADIVIRLIDDVGQERKIIKYEDIRIELLPEYQIEELKALLGFYDACKKEKKPFLRSLYGYLGRGDGDDVGTTFANDVPWQGGGDG